MGCDRAQLHFRHVGPAEGRRLPSPRILSDGARHDRRLGTAGASTLPLYGADVSLQWLGACLDDGGLCRHHRLPPDHVGRGVVALVRQDRHKPAPVLLGISPPHGFQGLPGEKAEEVTRILADLAQTRDFAEELRLAVEATIPADRRAAANQADAAAILELTELELEQHLSDEISLRVRAKMTLEWGPNLQERDSLTTDYEYETSDRHVDDWLLDDGVAFDAGFTEGIEAIANQMSRNIFSPEAQ